MSLQALADAIVANNRAREAEDAEDAESHPERPGNPPIPRGARDTLQSPPRG